MISAKRWARAQAYERDYWHQVATRIETGARGQLNWYQWKASEMERRLKKYTGQSLTPDMRILEIGSGPIGIVSYLSDGDRYAIDPLEDYYKTNHTLTKLRNEKVYYKKGSGEQISFPDGYFSMVVCDNVIDHASNPEKIIKEIYRVLDYNSIFYLSLNVHIPFGKWVHAVLAKLYIDKGHPHSFTQESIRSILIENAFRVEGEEIENYFEIRQKNRSSRILKEKIKGYTGLSEIHFHAIARKVS